MTDASPLPRDVEQLLRGKIRSLTQLETLLLVRGGPHTAADVARSLGISQLHAEDELMQLVAVRLVRAEGATYTLAASSRTATTIDAIAGLYPTYRVAISSAIFSKKDARSRSFSEAFRIRRDAE
jgi:predicted transcriptional regulator